MRIVLDTNVLVSAILSPYGPPAGVLSTLLTERVALCFDERILSEYRDVLTRGKFAFDPEVVQELIGFLASTGSPTLAVPLAVALPDAGDRMFLEVALSSRADFLVTGNLKHFPPRARAGVRVISPRDFVDAWLSSDR